MLIVRNCSAAPVSPSLSHPGARLIRSQRAVCPPEVVSRKSWVRAAGGRSTPRV